MGGHCFVALYVSILFLLCPLPAAAASLEKADRCVERAEWAKARAQYAAVIRNGGLRERELANLGIVRTYFLEKDFQGVLRTLRQLSGRVPENKNGAWMHVMGYRAARTLGWIEPATAHVQAIHRAQPSFSMAEIASHLAELKKLGLLNALPPAWTDTLTRTARHEHFLLAESLMSLEMHRSASRIWRLLVAGPPDEIGRQSLLRMGQALDADGESAEAERYLNLFAVLFAEDPRAADALYRVGRWRRASGASDATVPYMLAAEYHPATLYGAAARVDIAWSWPARDPVRAALRALRETPGLPDAILERGLALALTHPDWLASESDREWSRNRYRLSFPLGPLADKTK